MRKPSICREADDGSRTRDLRLGKPERVRSAPVCGGRFSSVSTDEAPANAAVLPAVCGAADSAAEERSGVVVASDGMIGRVYIWRGQRWRVLVRWRTPDRDEPYTWIAPCCGHVVVGDYRGREVVIVGDESYCAECGAMWTERRPAGHCCIDGWQPGGRAVVRNVLIENVETGERTVRPFRGLRRA